MSASGTRGIVPAVRTIELVGGVLDGATIRVPSHVAAVPLIEPPCPGGQQMWYIQREGDPFHFDLTLTAQT